MAEMADEKLLALHNLLPDDIKILETFSKHKITADSETIRKAQQEKLTEQSKRVQFRNQLAEHMIVMAEDGDPYHKTAECFESDAKEFLECANRNETTKSRITVICTQPLIVIYDGFLSEDECQWSVANYQHEQQQQHVRHPGFDLNGTEAKQEFRRSSMVTFKHGSDFATMMRTKIMDAFFKGSKQIQLETVEGSFIQHYTKDGFVANHHDYLSGFINGVAGERTFTTIVYLDTHKTGGETTFPYIGLQIQPVRGRLLLWQNALSPGTSRGNRVPDVLTHHYGNIVEAEKYIITTFLLDVKWLGIVGDGEESVSCEGLKASDEPPLKRIKL